MVINVLFRKLSTVERVYNIGLEQKVLSDVFKCISGFIKEAEEDLIKLYDLRILDKIPVDQIMTKDVVLINEEDSVDELERIIKKYKHMGYPVVDKNGNLVGIVTFKDLGKKKGGLFLKNKIKDIMTPKEQLILISPDTSASESQKIMAKNAIGRLLVVDENENIVGIVSKGDIVRTYQIYSNKVTKIKECSRITNFYFYDCEKSKMEKLADDLVILLGGRGFIISEKEDYIEILTRDWEPLAKIMKNRGKIDHISLTTKLLDILELSIVNEILGLIEKYSFEEIVITDHITLIDERSSIQRIITDVTSFRDSKKTFGTITIRSDF
ncbi:MAG: hypothetical protein PWP15_597 [Methanothermococcus sp.]|jgi:CBS domain-containing protein|nr:hypothetical protein [Methanothermococcus sp.]MDK2988000.1 hypothetical protein [Methanothermococcus sp.]